jgi:hypothetical protein
LRRGAGCRTRPISRDCSIRLWNANAKRDRAGRQAKGPALGRLQPANPRKARTLPAARFTYPRW